MMDYSYLDGLRGIGAFVVYLTHFLDHFYHLPETPEKYNGMPKDERLPDYFREIPILVLAYHGYFWVVVFFILSGFVLTLRFFKIKKHTCITGGTFRRYLRLMIPLWVILSLYYLALRLEVISKEDLKEGNDLHKIKDKTFLDMVYDSLFSVWYGDNDWAIAVWTLSIELTATFMVYLIAQTVVEYKGRQYIYILIIAFFLIPYYINKHGYSN
jgi:peptidoglycan/LPS O-acetylase OafA/YrhL